MTAVEILVTAPLHPAAMAGLHARFIVHHLWEAADPAALLRRIGPNIRAVATTTLFGCVDAALLEHLPALEIVASFGVGYDNVDAALAAARGIVVTNTPGVLDEEVADLAVGLLLSTLRQIPQADRFVREDGWRQGSFPLSATLRGRRIGIVGLGNIGKAVARRLAAFDLSIAFHGRTRQPDVAYPYHPTSRDLAEACDVLVVLVPGGPTTRHLIDRDVLQALGSDGVLINVSRGSVIDEQALIGALQTGTIAAAGLDVYEDEPNVPPELIAMPQVVLLPHIGSASAHTRAAMARLLVDNLVAWFESGRAVTPVAETRHLIRR